MNATTTAMKYRPEAWITGRSLDTIARKLARGINRRYDVRKISESINRPFPAGGTYLDQSLYIVVDERGQDIADTIFAVTEERALRGDVQPGDPNTVTWNGRTWTHNL